jgi:hypothetical protein
MIVGIDLTKVGIGSISDHHYYNFRCPLANFLHGNGRVGRT